MDEYGWSLEKSITTPLGERRFIVILITQSSLLVKSIKPLRGQERNNDINRNILRDSINYRHRCGVRADNAGILDDYRNEIAYGDT